MTRPQLRQVENVRIFEAAVNQIRDLIRQGALAPGEKLPTEQELGNRLKVGRSSIREALRVLEAEGLVEVRRGAGVFVAQNPTKRRMRDEVALWLQERDETIGQLLQVRESIEGLTAALVASSASVEIIQHLREIVTLQQEKAAKFGTRDEDLDGMAELDAAFHLAISAASGNDIAHEIVSHILPAFYESNKAVLYVVGRVGRLLEDHQAILRAIEAGDSVEAEKAMRSHIARVRNDIHDLRAAMTPRVVDPSDGSDSFEPSS